MTNSSGLGVFISGRPKSLIVAVVVTGLVVVVAGMFLLIGFGGYTWRSAVSVTGAELYSPNRLVFNVDSCNKHPEVSVLRETDVDVQVEVVVDSHPFLLGRLDCQDAVEVKLQEPLGDRVVVDKHTGRSVSVIGVIPHTVADARASAEWRLVDVPGWPNKAGFSLRLPPGWELHELKGIDSYIGGVVGDAYFGEVIGDGARLTFDYGGSSWSLAPSDDRARTYAMGWEDISGVRARLLISMNPGAGYTGAFFHRSGGPNLHLVGEDLTLEQQRIAVAVFRSIHFLGQTNDDP